MRSIIERSLRFSARHLWLLAIFLGFFAIAYSGRATGAPAVAPPAPIASGQERVFVYIGSSTCRFSNIEGLEKVVGTIREHVRQSAQRDSRRFVTVGIAKDSHVRAGLDHLEKFGSFDEVMTGRGWANIGVLKYMFDQLPGPGATPQIIIVDREVVADGGLWAMRNERVVARRLGTNELQEWARNPSAFDDTAAKRLP